MKFEKLVQLMEAKGVGPGNAYKNAMNATKPKEFPTSSPVFGNTNQELPTQRFKWELREGDSFDTTGDVLKTQAWKNMQQAFGLLFNDDNFDVKVQELSKDFNKHKDSYKNIKMLAGLDDVEIEKYDEESALDKLTNRVAKYKSDLTGLEKELAHYTKIKNRGTLSPAQKNELKIEVATLQAKLKAMQEVERGTTRVDKEAFSKRIVELGDRLAHREEKLLHANYDDADKNRNAGDIVRVQDKLKKKTKQLEDAESELEELTSRIDTINASNEELNTHAVDLFTKYVKDTAGDLLIKLKKRAESVANGATISPNWDVPPEKLDDAVAKLEALASDSPEDNPIIGYFEKFQDWYQNREADPGKLLDKNVNISMMRDFNRLPFVIMMKIYSNLRTNRKIISLDHLNTARNDEAVEEVLKALGDMSKHTRANHENWGNPQTKLYLSQLIDLLPNSIPQSKKNEIKSMLNRTWSFINNKTVPTLMIEEITRALRKRYTESFDKTLAKYMKAVSFDEEEFKMDLIEVAGRCFDK